MINRVFLTEQLKYMCVMETGIDRMRCQEVRGSSEETEARKLEIMSVSYSVAFEMEEKDRWELLKLVFQLYDKIQCKNHQCFRGWK